jgi:hypothetical protein
MYMYLLPYLSFQKLNLTFNEINQNGANAIADAMEGKTNLELLELDGKN